MTDGSRVALLAGATGLVGSRCLVRLLREPGYALVIALVRRPLAFDDPRLDARVVDFGQLAAVDLPRIDDAYCALGTTIKQAGSRAAFRLVDHDYVVAVARRAADCGASQFVLVSSLGASARSSVFYSRVKGETERDVAAFPFRAVHLLRPSLLVGERAVQRPLERLAGAVSRAMTPLFVGPVRKYRPILADAVAQAMLAAARAGGTGTLVYESDRIARLAHPNGR